MSTKKTPSVARFVDPRSGEEQTVQLGLPLQDGNIRYEEAFHKGHLQCQFCNAAVREQGAEDSLAGSSAKGRGAFFTPEKQHDADCALKKQTPSKKPRTKIDHTKGYRVHVDTSQFSELFNVQSGVYDVTKGGRIASVDPDLKNRESYRVKSAADFIAFIEKADPKRLNDSVIIFRNKAWKWEEVCIRYGKEARFKEVVERAKKADPSEMPLVLMQVDHPSMRWGEFKKPFTTIRSEEFIPHGRDDRGFKRRIIPTIEVVNGSTYGLAMTFSKAGSVFVMGLLKVETWTGDYITEDQAIVRVDRAAQVANVNIANLSKTVTAKTAPKGAANDDAPQLGLKFS